MPLNLLVPWILLLRINGGGAFNGSYGDLRLRMPPPRSHYHPFQSQPSKRSAKQKIPKSLLHSSSDVVSRDGNPTHREDNSTSSTVASQAALIAGTTIGGGFLALPAATAPCGAAPAAFGLVGVWLFLLGGAFSLTSAIFAMNCDGRDEEDARMRASDISLFSLVRECFGGLAGTLSGLLFLLLVKVTLVAQLSKVGVLLEASLPVMDRRVWTTVFSISITILCFASKQRNIERTNDTLTTAMLISFASLVALAGGSGWSPDGLTRAEYKSLLPSLFSSSASSGTWAIPIFVQLLLYNEVVPLVASRLGDERKVRRAIVFGSSVPLIMCLVWSCVALGLVPYEVSTMGSGAIYDPLTSLGDAVSSKGGSVGKLFLVSVNMLAGSAICTTVIGSILASAQYFDDIIASLIRHGHRFRNYDGNATSNSASATQDACISTNAKRTILSKYRKLITHTLAVAPSAVIALWGSSNLYYRATSFAGEFPCTLLYGLIPPLCNLRIQWMRRHGKTQSEVTHAIPWKDMAFQTLLAAVSLVLLVAGAVSK